MLKLFHQLAAFWMKKRIPRLEYSLQYPSETQERLLKQLIQAACATEFGKVHHFTEIKNLTDYQKRVPIRTYEQYYPYIELELNGKANV
ncbi:MAG: GH3 auxin-responsive promoter family protein, partial [Bacteroidia bacterium]|nr:GH3 auxin-responsive promoter family protein [Bacteroidia bacterium]